jgi:hypothetical protein
MTCARICAIDDVLNGQVGVWPGSLLKEDVGSVSQGTGAAVRPAASTAREVQVRLWWVQFVRKLRILATICTTLFATSHAQMRQHFAKNVSSKIPFTASRVQTVHQ